MREFVVAVLVLPRVRYSRLLQHPRHHHPRLEICDCRCCPHCFHSHSRCRTSLSMKESSRSLHTFIVLRAFVCPSASFIRRGGNSWLRRSPFKVRNVRSVNAEPEATDSLCDLFMPPIAAIFPPYTSCVRTHGIARTPQLSRHLLLQIGLESAVHAYRLVTPAIEDMTSSFPRQLM